MGRSGCQSVSGFFSLALLGRKIAKSTSLSVPVLSQSAFRGGRRLREGMPLLWAKYLGQNSRFKNPGFLSPAILASIMLDSIMLESNVDDVASSTGNPCAIGGPRI